MSSKDIGVNLWTQASQVHFWLVLRKCSKQKKTVLATFSDYSVVCAVSFKCDCIIEQGGSRVVWANPPVTITRICMKGSTVWTGIAVRVKYSGLPVRHSWQLYWEVKGGSLPNFQRSFSLVFSKLMLSFLQTFNIQESWSHSISRAEICLGYHGLRSSIAAPVI